MPQVIISSSKKTPVTYEEILKNLSAERICGTWLGTGADIDESLARELAQLGQCY